MSTRPPSDRGFTLVELLIAILVIVVGVVAVAGALHIGIRSGTDQRGLSKEELTLRSFAEQVKAEGYVPCAPPDQYGLGFIPPEGITAAVVEVAYWDGAVSPGAALVFGVLCSPDPDTGRDAGLQQIHLRVEAPVSVRETLIVKREPSGG